MREGGRIVHIGSSNSERMPFVGGSVYALTKGAVAGFTKGLARDLGPRGITVNNVQPGPIDTDMNPANTDFARDIVQDKRQLYVRLRANAPEGQKRFPISRLTNEVNSCATTSS